MITKAFKVVLTVVLVFVCLLTYAQKEVPDSNFHLYLLIGQSNMAGRGVVDKESKNTNPKILMLDSMNNWITATDPVHFDKPNAVGVGPAISFAKEMLGKKNIKIGLIPCAWGGSPIKAWEPGALYLKTAHPFDDAIKRTKIAMQKGVLKGILWHQGESDNVSLRAAKYIDKLTTLIKRLRNNLEQPNLPFIAGEIGYFNKTNFINPIINNLTQEVPFTAVVSAQGLTHKGDSLHFNTSSARELGKRYALAMKRFQSTAKLSPANNSVNSSRVVVLCFDDAEISHYTIVAPLLKKYGFDATFLVCEMPLKSAADSSYYMNWPQIAALHKMGFEIGNHTGHHKNMTKLDRKGMEQEISYIEDKCRQYGIPKPISFAYPGNREDPLSQAVLKQMGYQYARTGGSRYYNAQEDKKLAIPSFTMGSTDKLQERTWTALKNLQEGQILAFTIHGVPDIAHPDYTTSAEVFNEYLKYMKENNFKVISLRNLNKYTNAANDRKKATQ